MVEHEQDITDQDHGDHVPGEEEILMETEDKNTDTRHHELVRKERETSPAQKIIHDRVQFISPQRNVPIGIAGVQEGKDDNKKKDEKKTGAVQVDIVIVMPVGAATVQFSAAEEGMAAEDRRRFFPAILRGLSVLGLTFQASGAPSLSLKRPSS